MQNISLQHRLEYWGYIAVEKMVCSLPDGALPTVARFFAVLAFYLLRIRRKVSLDNLRIAFPRRSDAWRKTIAYRSYIHFALVILEFMKMRVWTPGKIAEKIDISEASDFLRTVKNGRGAILVSGHFGNWEIPMGYIHTLGIRSVAVQQRQNNLLINEHMHRLRERWGIRIIYPGGALKKFLQALNEGELVALLGDQDAGERGTFVSFFNRPSSTHVGTALLYLRSGAPLFFGACIRKSSGNYLVKTFFIDQAEDRAETPSNIQRVTAAFTEKLEEMVRKYPEQYFWMHRRWKTRPTTSSPGS